MMIPLNYALVCLNCDTIYDTRDNRSCPKCGGLSCHPIGNWIKTIGGGSEEVKDSTKH